MLKAKLPSIDYFNGIKINIYNGDHRPPHIHAIYNEYEILLEIETGNIYRGRFPVRELKQIKEWLAENKEWAFENIL